MTIKEIIEKNRPLLSKSSVRTYNSIITNLALKCKVKLDSASDIVENVSTIIDHLKEVPARLRKTTLSALVVAVDDKAGTHPKVLERLRHMMMGDSKVSKEEDDTQEKTVKQTENWLEWPEVLALYNKLKKDADRFMKDEDISKHKLEVIKMYVLLSMFVLIDPRRSSDIVNFKIRNIDKDKDNYMNAKSNKLVYNTYKTAKTYGKQEIDLPKELKRIITKWMTINKSDYLIPDTKDSATNSSKITAMFYNFFGKKVSTNMLRHSKITSLYKDVPALAEMKKAAAAMGHSLEEHLAYIKK
jgi:integrase